MILTFLLLSMNLFAKTGTDQLDLSSVRNSCHLLTDDDIKFLQKLPASKRNKGVKRKTKQICESLELAAWRKSKVDDKIKGELYQLNWLEASYTHKSVHGDRDPGFLRKIRMGLETLRTASTPMLKKKKLTHSEASNLPITRPIEQYSLDELALMDPKESFFWQKWKDDVPLKKRFDQLAKEKDIKAKGHLVLEFNGVSNGGSAPKVKAKDSDLDNEWSLKWGDEIHSDVVGSRIFAAMGYDVDHPYYREKDDLTLIFPEDYDAEKMVQEIWDQFKVNVRSYISLHGKISEEDIQKEKKLRPYVGRNYARFVECAVEGRPDKVKRLGAMMSGMLGHPDLRELRGSLLLHLFVGNWDTREENTLLTVVHEGKFKYHLSGVFSDIGTSFGIKTKVFPPDFRAGLVNEFSWDIVTADNIGNLKFLSTINEALPYFKKATYTDLKWMANKLAKLDGNNLDDILDKSGWPKAIRELYFQKLASRREQILNAFEIKDPHPIPYDRNFSYEHNGIKVVDKGVLIHDFKSEKHPLGYLSPMGRVRNYGGTKP